MRTIGVTKLLVMGRLHIVLARCCAKLLDATVLEAAEVRGYV